MDGIGSYRSELLRPKSRLKACEEAILHIIKWTPVLDVTTNSLGCLVSSKFFQYIIINIHSGGTEILVLMALGKLSAVLNRAGLVLSSLIT